MTDPREPSPRRAARSAARASAGSSPATSVAPLARHGRLRRSRAWRGVAGFLAIALGVTLISAGSVAAVVVWDIGQNIQSRAVELGDPDDAPVPGIGEIEGGFNIMIVGVDNDPDQSSAAYGKRDGAILNDVNILLHVSADHTSATAVSIPRDMVVPVPACETEDGRTSSAMSGRPMNETYFYGGLKCVVDTVEDLTGLEIPYGGVITFDGVIGMSNAVGGVDVCVDGPINDKYTGLNLPAAGTYTLQGQQAEQFVRTRHGVGDGSDLGRISSQQVFMSALLRKLMSEDTFSDFGRLFTIAETATTNMKLSTTLADVNQMVSIGLALKSLSLDRVTFVQYPGSLSGTGIFAGKVQPVKSQATKLFDKIRNDEPFALDADALGEGSVLDPNAPITDPPVTDPSATPDPTATDPAQAEVLSGIKGQTAATQTCAAANN
jgi:LCP family protein required for cell wall assembly